MSTSVLLKSDIFNLPFSKDEEGIVLSPTEDQIRKDVIKYLVKLNQSTASSLLFKQITKPQAEDFGEVFCKAINPIYEDFGQKWQVDSFTLNAQFVGYAFCYGRVKSEPLVDWGDHSDQSIYNLIYNQTQRNVRITRVLRAYLHIDGYDVLVFIKPNLLRYWLKSVALRDTDETFADLKRAGF